MKKFIFVTGGVVSSLGKGITAASLGTLMKRRGLKVSIIKMDPYINVDAGTMDPFQHGEVFVTDDGAETDLDLGHYERFIDERLSYNNSITAGKVYSEVIRKERAKYYNGGTVQVIPHVTNEIQERILRASHGLDILIAEIGGTVGDIEGLPFLEAIRQFPGRVGRENLLYCHVTLIPYIGAAGELKTKPTQHSVNELRRIGIQPDLIVCRSTRHISSDMKDKIALFCSVSSGSIFEALDEETIYRVPVALQKQGLDRLVLKKLGLSSEGQANLDDWFEFMEKMDNPSCDVNIALVGKHADIKDACLSVHEAIAHAAAYNQVRVNIKPVETEDIEKLGAEACLSGVHGIIIPGGFDSHGVEGKISAASYARESGTPYFGLCLGMQVAVIDYARNVASIASACSSEVDPGTPNPVIHVVEEQKNTSLPGSGSLRIGAYPCRLKENSRAFAAYKETEISERHRHSYEFNNDYRERLENAGLKITGICPDGDLVEIIELEDHPWFVGVQFHPEFLSRPLTPHPLFRDFIEAAKKIAVV